MTLFRFSRGLDPMDRLLSLQRELDRAFQNPHGLTQGLSGRGAYPPVNVFWDKDSAVVRLEVPGIAADALSIETHGRTLTIGGKRDVTVPDGASFHRRERGAGEFKRSIQLSEDLDTSRADASYRQGILTVRIPKKEEAKPRQIQVHAA